MTRPDTTTLLPEGTAADNCSCLDEHRRDSRCTQHPGGETQ